MLVIAGCPKLTNSAKGATSNSSLSLALVEGDVTFENTPFSLTMICITHGFGSKCKTEQTSTLLKSACRNRKEDVSVQGQLGRQTLLPYNGLHHTHCRLVHSTRVDMLLLHDDMHRRCLSSPCKQEDSTTMTAFTCPIGLPQGCAHTKRAAQICLH